MTATPIGRRYARALMELADEQNLLDDVSKSMDALLSAWQTSEELRNTFENPAFDAQLRKNLVDAIGTKLGAPAIVTNLLKLLSDRRRTRHFPEVVDAFQELSEERTGRVRAEVTTATEMPDAYYTKLQKTLEASLGKKVQVVPKLDPAIIAGVITRVGDQVFDGSVRNRLSELKEELLTR